MGTKQNSLVLAAAAFALVATGCVHHRSPTNSPADLPRVVSIRSTLEFQEYDEQFVREVKEKWYSLLELNQVTKYRPGKVVVRFQHHEDGHLTDVAILKNTTGDKILGRLCVKALRALEPFPPWTRKMRRKVDKTYRPVYFTFFYEGPRAAPSAGGRRQRTSKEAME